MYVIIHMYVFMYVGASTPLLTLLRGTFLMNAEYRLIYIAGA
jgi:hypothetical protein